MDYSTFPPITLVVAAASLTVLVLLYYAALPKPIPGIPHNHESARSVLGDIPAMLKWKSETRETFSWVTLQCKKLNSPIIQIFPQPFSMPWVIVTDARECYDVLVRRSREFDRSLFIINSVEPVLREHFFPMPSGPKQRAHRALLSDLMTPDFLHEIAAPQLYDKTLALLRLWRRKASLAQGHAFAAAEDMHNTALDTIWAAAVGSEAGATQSQLDHLIAVPSIPLPVNVDDPVQFPPAPALLDATSIRTVIESIEVGVTSPFPRLSLWFYKKLPWVRRAFKRKDRLLDIAFNEAEAQFNDDANGTQEIKSAMDYILRREIVQARKEQRAPQFDTTVLKDELFGFLLAGHETTSTAMTWGLRYLTQHQEAQEKLRKEMRETMSGAVGRQPTYSEITTANMPYFDAVVEEILRCSGTASNQARTNLVDADLLGYRIPAGTNVLFMTNGPTFVAPPIGIIHESSRSSSSQASKGKIGEWNPMDVSQFKPERWLKSSSEGRTICDLQAGPNMQFGGGPRGCFGKRFAYLEMRTVMTIIFWNFKLLPVAPELSDARSYDCVTHCPEQCYVRLEAI